LSDFLPERIMSDFLIKPPYAHAIRWSKHGSCGNPGCKDKQCCCAFCGLPIGTPKDDPRWDDHDQWCGDCELCRDQVPIMLFRGEGKQMEQASFHGLCFEKIVHFRSRAGGRS
jgi:hypothetical protein